MGNVTMRPLAASDPQRVGHYRMLGELGRGGMGRVLLGSAPDGRPVAVKLMHARLAGTPGFRERFHAEVAATRSVSGAYTAAVLDADADAPTPWLASVYVPGPSLRDAVRAAGPLPEPAVLRLAAGLAAALVEIHRAGLVHRDLKPSNVLLAADAPKVIDFGVARAAESEGDGPTGVLAGTPGYMSPEQAEEGSATAAGDVFSLGSVLVYACTGRGPFDGPGPAQALYNVVHAEPDLSGVPDRLRPAVAACLAKAPARRPTPARLAAMVGGIAPAAQPWPPAVQRMIDERRAWIGWVPAPEPAATLVYTRRPRTALGSPRGALVAGGVLAALATALVVATLVVSPWSGSAARSDSGTHQSATPLPSRSLRGHTASVRDLAFTPDGRTLASAGDDSTARLWNVADGKQRRAPLDHPDGVNALAISHGGSTLYTAGDDGSLRLFPVSGKGEPTDLDIDLGPLTSLALSPDDRVLATSNTDQSVRLWDLDDGKVGPLLETGAGNVQALAFAPDSRTLAIGTTGTEEDPGTGNTRGVAQTWEVYDRKKLSENLSGHDSWIEDVAFSPDGQTLATAGGKIVRLWDVAQSLQKGTPFQCDGRCHTAVFSPDGRTLATGDSEGTTRLWDVTSHRQRGPTLTGKDGAVLTVRFSPDGHTLATGTQNGTIHLWKVPA
ncbi:serine/threonine-protein kinase [Actinomadura luteofluorescens]